MILIYQQNLLKWVGHDDIVFALIYQLGGFKINISILHDV